MSSSRNADNNALQNLGPDGTKPYSFRSRSILSLYPYTATAWRKRKHKLKNKIANANAAENDARNIQEEEYEIVPMAEKENQNGVEESMLIQAPDHNLDNEMQHDSVSDNGETQLVTSIEKTTVSDSESGPVLATNVELVSDNVEIVVTTLNRPLEAIYLAIDVSMEEPSNRSAMASRYSLRKRTEIALHPYTRNRWVRPETLPQYKVDTSVLREPLSELQEFNEMRRRKAQEGYETDVADDLEDSAVNDDAPYEQLPSRKRRKLTEVETAFSRRGEKIEAIISRLRQLKNLYSDESFFGTDYHTSQSPRTLTNDEEQSQGIPVRKRCKRFKAIYSDNDFESSGSDSSITTEYESSLEGSLELTASFVVPSPPAKKKIDRRRKLPQKIDGKALAGCLPASFATVYDLNRCLTTSKKIPKRKPIPRISEEELSDSSTSQARNPVINVESETEMHQDYSLNSEANTVGDLHYFSDESTAMERKVGINRMTERRKNTQSKSEHSISKERTTLERKRKTREHSSYRRRPERSLDSYYLEKFEQQKRETANNKQRPIFLRVAHRQIKKSRKSGLHVHDSPWKKIIEIAKRVKRKGSHISENKTLKKWKQSCMPKHRENGRKGKTGNQEHESSADDLYTSDAPLFNHISISAPMQNFQELKPMQSTKGFVHSSYVGSGAFNELCNFEFTESDILPSSEAYTLAVESEMKHLLCGLEEVTINIDESLRLLDSISQNMKQLAILEFKFMSISKRVSLLHMYSSLVQRFYQYMDSLDKSPANAHNKCKLALKLFHGTSIILMAFNEYSAPVEEKSLTELPFRILKILTTEGVEILNAWDDSEENVAIDNCLLEAFVIFLNIEKSANLNSVWSKVYIFWESFKTEIEFLYSRASFRDFWTFFDRLMWLTQFNSKGIVDGCTVKSEMADILAHWSKVTFDVLSSRKDQTSLFTLHFCFRRFHDILVYWEPDCEVKVHLLKFLLTYSSGEPRTFSGQLIEYPDFIITKGASNLKPEDSHFDIIMKTVNAIAVNCIGDTCYGRIIELLQSELFTSSHERTGIVQGLSVLIILVLRKAVEAGKFQSIFQKYKIEKKFDFITNEAAIRGLYILLDVLILEKFDISNTLKIFFHEFEALITVYVKSEEKKTWAVTPLIFQNQSGALPESQKAKVFRNREEKLEWESRQKESISSISWVLRKLQSLAEIWNQTSGWPPSAFIDKGSLAPIPNDSVVKPLESQQSSSIYFEKNSDWGFAIIAP